VAAVIRVLLGNAETARSLVAALAGTVGAHGAHGDAPACACRHALDHAIITSPEARDAAMIERLRGIAGRVL
jgi:5'-methylthioadenosine phosphorylase